MEPFLGLISETRSPIDLKFELKTYDINIYLCVLLAYDRNFVPFYTQYFEKLAVFEA